LSEELDALRAELAALKAQVSDSNRTDLNSNLYAQRDSASRESLQEVRLRSSRGTQGGGEVREVHLDAARVLMEHDPVFWQAAQQAREND